MLRSVRRMSFCARRHRPALGEIGETIPSAPNLMGVDRDSCISKIARAPPLALSLIAAVAPNIAGDDNGLTGEIGVGVVVPASSIKRPLPLAFFADVKPGKARLTSSHFTLPVKTKAEAFLQPKL